MATAEIIDQLISEFKVPRLGAIEPDEEGWHGTGPWLSGERVDRMIGQDQATWFPKSLSVRELAGLRAGTWIVPDGFDEVRVCRTKAEAMNVLKGTLSQLGDWGMVAFLRVAKIERPEYDFFEATVEVEEFCCAFGDEDGRYPDCTMWLDPIRYDV